MNTEMELRPEQVINRELSWLEFNQRVLDEAVSPFNPVFEQMKFLSIAASNLDEFFMIRVGSLWDQIDAGYKRPDFSGLTPREQVSAISKRVHAMMKRMYSVLRRDILPELTQNGIHFADVGSLTEEQAAWLDRYYDEQVYPVLTPMAVDSSTVPSSCSRAVVTIRSASLGTRIPSTASQITWALCWRSSVS